jgi:hypothetical protein
MKVTSRKRNEQKNIYLLRLFVEKYMPTRSKLSFPGLVTNETFVIIMSWK